ncbi:MAG: transcription initiation factor IIB [Nitrosotalea sp.]
MALQNNLMNFDSNTCYACQGKIVSDIDRGEKICSHCGMVSDNSDLGNFHNADLFSEMENKNEGPTSSMMYEIGLHTFIDKKNIDAGGKHIVGYSEIERLRRLNRFTISNYSKTRNLNKAVREIRRITGILEMPTSIAERACYIYRKALSKKIIRGRSITGIVAATIYIACKDAGVFFPIDKMEDLIENCNKRNIVQYYKLLLRQMEISVETPDPAQYVSRIAKRARLNGRTERRALEVLSQIEGEPLLSGKKPVSLAAGALYLAALQIGEHITQLRLAIASELTTITIRNRYVEIEKMLKQKTACNGTVTSKEDEEIISQKINSAIVTQISG